MNQQNNQVRNSTFTQYLGARIGYGGSNLAELYGKIDLEGKSNIVIKALKLFDPEITDIKTIVQNGIAKLYVTLGEKGALFFFYLNKIRKKFKPVEKMVNTSGAGDSFFATVIFGNIKNLTEEQSLELAMAAGILTVKSSETISPELS